MNVKAYELVKSQVPTSDEVVRLLWRAILGAKKEVGTVLDLGAGVGTLSKFGAYRKYLGIEIDELALKGAPKSKKRSVRLGCAFDLSAAGFDVVIGNPPYERHQDIDSTWRSELTSRFKRTLGIQISGLANLYLYFLALALEKSRDDGLVAFIIPHEWVSRPSAKEIRLYIEKQKWAVDVYKLRDDVFPTVMTTACITIIDKSKKTGNWRHFKVTKDFKIKSKLRFTGASSDVLPYEKRGQIWASRGLSPGGQELFVLTEAERLEQKLTLRDVSPCVTTLRNLPQHWTNLTKIRFQKEYVQKGRRCWLVRTDRTSLSTRLLRYVRRFRRWQHDNYTCNARVPWYRYSTPKRPQALVAQAFTTRGPKVLLNSAGVLIAGATYGIYAPLEVIDKKLIARIRGMDIRSRVTPHSYKLRKIEVRQLNGLLKKLT